MTAPKAVLRQRRRTSAVNLPSDLVRWFAGEIAPAPELPPLKLTPEQVTTLRSMPASNLSRAERRALRLPVLAPTPSPPWSAKAWPGYALLPERWAAWKREHPDAHPPIGYAWLDDPNARQQPPSWLVSEARKCARRGKS